VILADCALIVGSFIFFSLLSHSDVVV